MLLITGPTGNVGRELVDVLDSGSSPRPWRAASRHPDDIPRARVDSVRLDFFDRSTWAAALAGIDTLFLLFPLPGNRTARNAVIPFLHAAQEAGCRHVVYVSVFGADRVRFIPHYKVEAALRASSMTWTVLRCGFFMQNLHRTVSTHGVDIVERGELYIPAGRGRTTFIDARDAAAVAALALQHPEEHRDVVYHLTGSESLSMAQVATALSGALGYPVRYPSPGLVAFARRLRAREVGWDSIGFMCAVYTLTRLGRNQQITDEVERLLHRSPRTLGQFLRDSAWRWDQRAWT